MLLRPSPVRIVVLLGLLAGAAAAAAQEPPPKPGEAPTPAAKDTSTESAAPETDAAEREPARPIAIGEAVPSDVTLTPVAPPASTERAPGDEGREPEPGGDTPKPRPTPAAPVAISVVSLTRGAGEPLPAAESNASATTEPAPASTSDGAPDATPKKPATDDAAPAPAVPAEPARPFVLLYWSRTCPVAKRYVGPYAELAKDFGKSVRFHFVVANLGESPQEARQALSDAGVALRVFADPERATARRFGVRVTPTALLVDAAGTLRYRGPIDDDRLAKAREPLQHLRLALTALLAGKPIEGAEPRPFGSAVRTSAPRR